MEEFRPIIADSVVITLINNRQITPNDFTQSHGGWFLKDPCPQEILRRLREPQKRDDYTPRLQVQNQLSPRA